MASNSDDSSSTAIAAAESMAKLEITAGNSPANAKTLTLVSSDGEKFAISQAAAELAIAIRNMMEDGYHDQIPVPNVSGRVLGKVIEYLEANSGEADLTEEQKTRFNGEFLVSQNFEYLIELIVAANYLNIRGLLDIVASEIAGIMRNKSVVWVREKFGIPNNFTPEEEAAIMEEYAWAHENLDEDK